MKILVAEDNLINQKVIRSILERSAYKFEIVSNGRQVLDKLGSENFDLILMDCQMPLVDGLQATIEIREFEAQLKKHRCPIVAITSFANDGARERCLELGMDDFLAKPFKSEELLQKIDTWAKILPEF